MLKAIEDTDMEFHVGIPKYGRDQYGNYYKLFVRTDTSDGDWWKCQKFSFKEESKNEAIETTPQFENTIVRPSRLEPISSRDFYEARKRAIDELIEAQPKPTQRLINELDGDSTPLLQLTTWERFLRVLGVK